MSEPLKLAPAAVRPQGHDSLLDRLDAAAQNSRDAVAGTLGHAFLFCGPSGVGKFAAARWWAARLKCERPRACAGECPPCRQVAAGSNPDLVILEPPEAGKAIKIERIREQLLPALSRRPLQSGPKIAMIRDCHLLTPDAQSATLKLLEEPPGFAVIVLVTERPSSLYPTIRSRCQTVRFGRVPAETITQLLVATGRSESTARRTARISRGSVGRAIEYDTDRLADRDDVIRGYESVCAGADLESFVVDLVERRKAGREGLEALLSWEVARIESSLGYAEAVESDTLAPTADASPREIERLIKRADRIRATLTALEQNVNAKLAIRDLLLDARAT